MRKLLPILLTFTIGTLATIAMTQMFAQTGIAVAAVDAPPSPAMEDIFDDAFAYLATSQNPDGGIKAYTELSDEFTTIKTVLALASSGRTTEYLAHSSSGLTPIDFLDNRAITYTHDSSDILLPGRAGMLLSAVTASDGNPESFGGMDLVTELSGTYQTATGAYSTTAQAGFTTGAASTINQLWSIIGLSSAGVEIPQPAIDYLIGLKESDGGWGYGFGGDVDTTGLVIQALVGSGKVDPNSAEIQEGLDFLRESQDEVGSWGYIDFYSGEYVANVDTTASAVQGIIAAGYVPVGAAWAKSQTPIEILLGMQDADGSFGGNALSTAHAIPALAEQAMPFYSKSVMADRALTYIHSLQTADGSWFTFFGHAGGPTTDAALAFISAGYDPNTITADGSSVSIIDFLATEAYTYSMESPDSAAKLALVATKSYTSSTDFGPDHVNIIEIITGTHYDAMLGGYGVITNTWHQSFPIIALAAAGEAVPVTATATLTGMQQADGGWKYDDGLYSLTSSADSTGLAIQALVATGMDSTDQIIIDALAYLSNTQDAMGGWGNANSTAYAIQGLIAAGEDLNDWAVNGHTPETALMSYQKSDGPFIYTWEAGGYFTPADDFFATRQSIPPMLGKDMLYYPNGLGLSEFSPVDRGPDPDRLVVDEPQTSWGNSIDVVIPFGSDLDMDASVSLDYRAVGDSIWTTGTTVYRADGYFTATLPITDVISYELLATFTDPDQVQYGTEVGSTVTSTITHEPIQLFLPMIHNDN